MEVYIVRHGETLWNAEGKLQGRVDIELNEKGREIAIAYGQRLKDTDFDAIFSSPLKRAYETACLIRGDRDIPIIKDDRLREISFGILEGTHYKEWLDKESPYQAFFKNPGQYFPPEEGESIEDLCVRTRDFLESVVEGNSEKYKRIMIVAHGALNKGLMCHIEKNDKAHFWGKGLQKNCEATIFNYDGSWTML